MVRGPTKRDFKEIPLTSQRTIVFQPHYLVLFFSSNFIPRYQTLEDIMLWKLLHFIHLSFENIVGCSQHMRIETPSTPLIYIQAADGNDPTLSHCHCVPVPSMPTRIVQHLAPLAYPDLVEHKPFRM